MWKKVVKGVDLQRKHNGVFVFADLNNSDENLYVDMGKYGVNSK